MSDEKLRHAAAFSQRMREQMCTTTDHGDRHAGWLIPRADGQGQRWVCEDCKRQAERQA